METISAMAIDNRKARFDYDLKDSFTAGMVLQGWEVKSLRAGHANMRAGWVIVRNDEVWLENVSISRWKFSQEEQEESRSRKLLLNRKEIKKLVRETAERGTTIVPLKIYSDKGFMKCEIAVAQGRKKYQKKQVLKDRDVKRSTARLMKDFNAK